MDKTFIGLNYKVSKIRLQMRLLNNNLQEEIKYPNFSFIKIKF